MGNVLNGMKLRHAALASVMIAFLVRGATGEAQDGALWTFDTGG